MESTVFTQKETNLGEKTRKKGQNREEEKNFEAKKRKSQRNHEIHVKELKIHKNERKMTGNPRFLGRKPRIRQKTTEIRGKTHLERRSGVRSGRSGAFLSWKAEKSAIEGPFIVDRSMR